MCTSARAYERTAPLPRHMNTQAPLAPQLVSIMPMKICENWPLIATVIRFRVRVSWNANFSNIWCRLLILVCRMYIRCFKYSMEDFWFESLKVISSVFNVLLDLLVCRMYIRCFKYLTGEFYICDAAPPFTGAPVRVLLVIIYMHS